MNLLENVVVINLEKRTDRLTQFLQQCQLAGLENILVSPGVDGQLLPQAYVDKASKNLDPLFQKDPKVIRGGLGAILGHLSAIQNASDAGFKTVTVFEDDAMLAPHFVEVVTRAATQLPDDWDLLYLGGNHHHRPKAYSEDLLLVTNTLCLHAFCASAKAFPKIINRLTSFPTKPIDHMYMDLHSQGTSYAVDPFIAYQSEGFSDIAMRKKNPSGTRKDSWMRR